MLKYKTEERKQRTFIEDIPKIEIEEAIKKLNPDDPHQKGDIRILNIMLKWNTVKRIYRQKYHQGRLYPRDGAGYILLSKSVRQELYSKYYNEIDAVNCYYAVLTYLMKKNGFRCENVEYYFRHRDECLSEIMAQLGCDKNEAKRHVLAVLFGERAKVKLTENIRREVVPFRLYCLEISESKNSGPTVLTYILQNNELKFICDCMDYLKAYAKTRWNENLNFVYGYDGFLCTKTPNAPLIPKILSDYLRKMYDLEIDFKVKF